MFDGVFFVSLAGGCYQLIKEAFEPTITAENWANRELYQKDLMDGVPVEQRMKNVKNGKYKLVNTHNEAPHPEPHRDKDGKIMIENYQLYKKDLYKYGGAQTMKWMEQGKYNLTKEELGKQRERINKHYEHLYSLVQK